MTGQRFSPRAIKGDPANPGYVLTTDADGVAHWDAPTAPTAVNQEGSFKTTPGILSVRSGVTRWYNDSGHTRTLVSIRIQLDVTSSSGTVTVDVNKNGTTVFTTQANRPTLAAGATIGSKVTAIDVTSWADGDYLTFDVDGAGTGAQGLLVLVVFTP